MRRGLERARAFAEAARLDARAADSLAIIVEEWLVNVVEHGGAAAGSRIVVRFERGPDSVRVLVTDAGRPFDPRTVTFQGPNLARGGGAGLALIRAWCRIADYRRRGGRNRLVLEMPLA